MALTVREATNIINDMLGKLGFDKKIPYQMIYTYVKKGKLKTTKAGLINERSFMEWAQEYLTKKIEAREQKQEETKGYEIVFRIR